MDTSAGAARKATTKEEKKLYREKGRCFECGKQGHLARTCPDKKAKARVGHIDDASEVTPEPEKVNPQESNTTTPMTQLAARFMKLTDDERAELVRAMRTAGEEMGFQEA